MKIKHLFIGCTLLGMALTGCCGASNPIEGENYSFKDGMIVFDEPARAAGQESMLGFAADPIPVVRVGFIGLGMRGPGAVQRFTHLEGVEIKGLCDLEQSNVDKCQRMLESAGFPKAEPYVGEDAYKQLCERDDFFPKIHEYEEKARKEGKPFSVRSFLESVYQIDESALHHVEDLYSEYKTNNNIR